MRKRVTIAIAILILLAAAAATIAQSQLPMIGASALLYPSRRPSLLPAPEHCVERSSTVWVFAFRAGPARPTR